MLNTALVEQFLRTGRVMDILFLIFVWLFVIYYITKAGRGAQLPKIRRIAAIDAIREGVGRAVEIRKPVHWSFGNAGAYVTDQNVSETLAGLGVMSYTVGLCARLGARFIFHMPGNPEAIPILEGTVLEAYSKEGKLEEFDRRRDLRYYGSGMMVFTAALAQSFMTEGVAMKIMMGRQPTCMYVALEAAKLQGAIVIGGTARWTAMYSFVLTCDYLFIGEEVFAAGAYVTGNPYMISSLASEEMAKYACIGILALGIVLSLANINFAALMKN